MSATSAHPFLCCSAPVCPELLFPLHSTSTITSTSTIFTALFISHLHHHLHHLYLPLHRSPSSLSPPHPSLDPLVHRPPLPPLSPPFPPRSSPTSTITSTIFTALFIAHTLS